ncbi:MAG TPA: acetyl-CoA carboxylase biotin carboxylase subunit [Catalimonadaceae bacterium]|nr:acetyl-CoA carboxylase biotin carboxylase subunit [Catalimonadaceae bacterium]
MTIKKLLVANRGEIAVRIMRSAREMGIQTVAVYSTADEKAQHVLCADEAYCIGNPPSSESYLRGDVLIQTALKAGAQAIHPGYGFLSENAVFAEQVRSAGLIFVGPSPESINAMGDKLRAKDAARKSGVPLVPGSASAINTIEEAKAISKETGFPLLIKASAGGGGKGMRVVNEESELESQMEMAMREAKSAFGDPTVFIERFVLNPKHIEIQIIGDQHGNVVHLFERDCSIQRRHQKVVEEAPSGILTPEIREAMGKDAVSLAKHCGYYSTGTVEFIVDKNLDYYFLEMNTRLQVEHPVTELITGLDLVKEQIRVAEGKPLDDRVKNVKMRGHAIEIRVCAEDPINNFSPDVGHLSHFDPPLGPGIRLDSGYVAGDDIPIFYDPLMAKLIVFADDRQSAIDRMILAIDRFDLRGVANTLNFCRWVMGHSHFREGWFDTNFIAQYFRAEMLEEPLSEEERLALAIGILKIRDKQYKSGVKSEVLADRPKSNWKKNRLNFG